MSHNIGRISTKKRTAFARTAREDQEEYEEQEEEADKIAPLRSAIFPIQTALFAPCFFVSISLFATAQKNPGTHPSQTVTFTR